MALAFSTRAENFLQFDHTQRERSTSMEPVSIVILLVALFGALFLPNYPNRQLAAWGYVALLGGYVLFQLGLRDDQVVQAAGGFLGVVFGLVCILWWGVKRWTRVQNWVNSKRD